MLAHKQVDIKMSHEYILANNYMVSNHPSICVLEQSSHSSSEAEEATFKIVFAQFISRTICCHCLQHQGTGLGDAGVSFQSYGQAPVK